MKKRGWAVVLLLMSLQLAACAPDNPGAEADISRETLSSGEGEVSMRAEPTEDGELLLIYENPTEERVTVQSAYMTYDGALLLKKTASGEEEIALRKDVARISLALYLEPGERVTQRFYLTREFPPLEAGEYTIKMKIHEVKTGTKFLSADFSIQEETK